MIIGDKKVTTGDKEVIKVIKGDKMLLKGAKRR